jgi:protein-S-isoprenylcysteine O-methyltransferase Ste14
MQTIKKVPLIRILIAFSTLPLMVIVVVPMLLHRVLPSVLTSPLFTFRGQRIGAFTLGLAGSALLYATNLLFVREGRGTLAPWSPPQKLVVKGPYRYIRHPMISGVLLILLGEVICLSSWASVIWFIFFLAANLVYILLLEERILLKRFGEEYRRYRQLTPMWVPRCFSQKENK